jgi:hypothetical protein
MGSQPANLVGGTLKSGRIVALQKSAALGP